MTREAIAKEGAGGPLPYSSRMSGNGGTRIPRWMKAAIESIGRLLSSGAPEGTEPMLKPCLAICPYLPMREPVEFSGWWLGPLAFFKGPWASAEFEETSRLFIKGFEDVSGKKRVENPAILARVDTGADGIVPPEEARRALARTIHFGTLDANPIWVPREKDPNLGLRMVTSDNSEVMFWPIDTERGLVATRRGFYVQVSGMGMSVTDDCYRMRAPLELPEPAHAVRLDPEILDACFEALSGPAPAGKEEVAARLGVAIDRYATVFRNTESISWDDRVVLLKVAFEALTNESKSWLAAKWVRGLFERVVKGEPAVTGMLWSPRETERHAWEKSPGVAGTPLRTDLEDWFAAFATARNEIIHEGRSKTLDYEKAGSAYEGPIIHTGERLFRETVRAVLADLGHGELWRTRDSRSMQRIYREVKAKGEAEKK